MSRRPGNPYPDKDLVLIRWKDSSSRHFSTWREIDTVVEFAKGGAYDCASVGWLVYENKDCVVLAPHVAVDADDVIGEMKIPKGAIESRTVLIAKKR
jgi:hypothetical protein